MTSNEFENHPIFGKLEQLAARITEEDVKSKINLEKLNFFESASKYIKDRLNLTIPILTPLSEFNTIAVEIESALAQINSFIGNNNIGHLSNAENNLNTALVRVRNLPLPFSKNDFNFSKSISNFEGIVKSKYDEIEKENKLLKTELDKIKNGLIEKQTQINQITDLLTKKSTEITNLTSTFQTDFNNIKSSSLQNYENDRKAFRTEITTDRNNYKTEFTNDKEQFKKDVAQKILEIDKKTAETISNINQKLDEAKRLVNVIGNVGVTGNYQNIANQHKRTANIWRYVAIGFMTILSGLLIYAIWDVSSANYDWIKSVIRIIAAAALSYPATYAAKESSRHRKLEIINRKLELELAALTPFIEMLPEEKKKEIKSSLVDKYFGNHGDVLDIKDAKDEDVSLSVLEKLIKTLLPVLKK
ncbi:MAG: hypothetical protein AB7V50_06625 [Vampirovibrionia bacterium]